VERDRISAKREQDFQNKILEALHAIRPPKPTRLGRTLKVANSPLFLVFVGLIVSFFVFYRQTYVQCVADGRKFFTDYSALKTELLYRENEVVSAMLEAKSVADLRNRIDPKKAFDNRFKDDTLLDLRTRYALASEFIDESGIDRSNESALQQSELYQKYRPVFDGIIGPTLSDSDLAPLKQIAAGTATVQMMNFFTDIRSEVEIQCIPQNVLLEMWGETPITIQRYDVGSFTEKERRRIRMLKGRNLLTPKVPPAPFPQTNFRPPDALVGAPTK
jgi:hypothetical protein